MLVCWRDDGFWTQLWYVCYRRLMNGLGGTSTLHLPGWGFVGQASTSFLATGPGKAKLTRTRMRRIHSIYDARLWRLTCVWQTSQHRSQVMQSGTGSEPGGHSWGAAGAEGSAGETKTISI